MTHAERYSTSEPAACRTPRLRAPRRVLAVLALAPALGVAATTFAAPGTASADQLSSDRAQAAAISSQISADNAQLQSLADQVNAASYKLSQLSAQIDATKQQIASDQSKVAGLKSQLRQQAIASYTTDGSSTQVSEMFSSNPNTSGIQSVYTNIATGNVTTTVDKLHSAQTELQGQQDSLQQAQAQAQATRDSLQGEQQQTASLVAQKNQELNGVNAQISNLVAQQQAAAAAAQKAAAEAAFAKKVAATQAAAPTPAASTGGGNGGGGGGGGGASSGGGGSSGGGSTVVVSAPPVGSGASGAVAAAESMIGVPYVWGGSTPAGFDCSGLVMWAYAQVGISLPHYSGAQYAMTTHIPLSAIAPGDLLFYGPGGSDHVAMYIGGGMMVEAPYTGASVWNTPIRTGGGFVGVGRVVG